MFYVSNREITCPEVEFTFESDSDKEDNNVEEEKNHETGEVNPNLVYDKDEKKEN